MIPLLIGVTSYLTAGILSLTFHRFRRPFSFLGWVGGTAGLSIAVASYFNSGSAVTHLGNWGRLGIELKLDQITVLFAGLAVVLNVIALIYLSSDEEKEATFYGLFNFLFATAFSLAFSHDLFNIYVTIELMSLISILLIGYERETYGIYAGIKYLLLSSLAMSLYLIGLGIIYMNGGSLGIEELASTLARGGEFSTLLGVGLLATGLAVKGGVLLFSMWLPDAYTYSGTVVSALLAGIATKFGLVGIVRLSEIGGIGTPLLILGGLTGLGGAGFALISQIPKKILAYSTISQVGLILIGVSSGTRLGVTAAALHLFFHGLLKALLFLSIGHAGVGKRDMFIKGGSPLPLASKLGLVVGSLSVMGVVPFNGFFSKEVLHNSLPGASWYLVLGISVLTAAYYLRLGYALLRQDTGREFAQSDFLLILFALLVAFSGGVVFVVPGPERFVELLEFRDVITSVGVVLVGGLFLAGIWKPLKEIDPPAFIFNLDNSLVSVFTGFLLIALFLFL